MFLGGAPLLDAIKKTLLAALKVVALTPEELKAIIAQFEAQGELTEEQGRKILEALLQRGRKEKEDVSERIGREFQKFADHLPLVSRSEFRELAARVERLERQFEAAIGTPPPAPEEVPPSGEVE
jgi:polyhydroxyalkanoate synthesis regulator phasin